MSKKDEGKVKKTVCIHWMQNQCKKGDKCEFLHVYDEDKIPPCRYYMKDQQCQKGDKCTYMHVKNGGGADKARGRDMLSEECPYYERGFCKQGTWAPPCKFFASH